MPPLRHHVEDVAELVPHLIARLTRGSELSCSPEAMRVLMRNRWPGNVEQLYQVLRKTVARRRAGVLTPADLPPETRAITRRVLTPLEAIECDAIVEALLDNHGNKAEAARHLGMSRATIYRKIRGYGISIPEPATGRRLRHRPGTRTVGARADATDICAERCRVGVAVVRLRGTHSVKPAARASVAVRNHTSALVRA